MDTNVDIGVISSALPESINTRVTGVPELDQTDDPIKTIVEETANDDFAGIF